MTVDNIKALNSKLCVQYQQAPSVTSSPVSISFNNSTFGNYTEGGLQFDWNLMQQDINVNSFSISNCTFIDDAEPYETSALYDTRYGVLVNSKSPMIIEDFKIVDNAFTNEYNSFFSRYEIIGVFLRNIHKGLIDNNTFEDNDQFSGSIKDYKGISIENCEGLTIRENSIVGTSSAFNSSKTSSGIEVFSSTGNLISCNNTDYLKTGVKFDDLCDRTDFAFNDISNHEDGLLMTPNAVIGQQPPTQQITNRGNQWFGTATLEGNFEFPDNDPFSVINGVHLARLEMSKFFIQTTDQSSTFWANPRSIDGVADNNYWFEYEIRGGIETYQCDFEVCCDNSSFSKSDNFVLNDSFPEFLGYEASTWDAEFSLFRYINSNPSLLSDSLASAWYYDKDSTNLGELYYAYRALVQPATDSTSTVQWLESYDSLNVLLDQLFDLDELIIADSTTAGEALHLTERDSVLSLFESEQSTFILLDSIVTSQIRSSAYLALSALSALVPTNDFEYNMKEVLSIQLDLLANGDSISQAQNDSLNTIAGKCRYSGGYGVILARMIIGNTDYVDSTICAVETRSVSEPPLTRSNSLQVQLQPNPAREYVVLKVSEQYIDGQVMFYNTFGQVVRNLNLNGTETYISTSDLPTGNYILAIWSDNQPQIVKKLFVNR